MSKPDTEVYSAAGAVEWLIRFTGNEARRQLDALQGVAACVFDRSPFGEYGHRQSSGSAAQTSGGNGCFGNQTRAILWRIRLNFLSVVGDTSGKKKMQWLAGVLTPRTMFGLSLRFLVAAICLLFAEVSCIMVYSEVLGLGKPRASLTMALYWGSIFFLWHALMPSRQARKAMRIANEERKSAQRITLLEQSVARGDARAAAALGEIYRSGKGTERDMKRALHYFDRAAVEFASAGRKAAAIRNEEAQAEVDNQRREMEALEPATLDATCPNCNAMLGIASVKCKQCGALFFLAEGGWRPVPNAPLTPARSNESAIYATAAGPLVAGVQPDLQQVDLMPAAAVPDGSDPKLGRCAPDGVEGLRSGRNIMGVVVALYAVIFMLGLGPTAVVLVPATIAVSMFAAVKICEALDYSPFDRLMTVVLMAVPVLGLIAVLLLVLKASNRLRQRR